MGNLTDHAKSSTETMISLIRGRILFMEEEITEKRNAILRHEALIKSIEKRNYYECPTGNESEIQMRAWWIRQVGKKNIHWTKKKKKDAK
jgi:hypothetical protein